MKFKALEELGRERLSQTFFMREFLHSEISQISGIPNIPHFPEIALENGKHLCEKILEPIQDRFGRLFIRSGYRSPQINALGAENKNQYNCSSNTANRARHIWDIPDNKGYYGAMACIVIPSFIQYFEKTNNWKTLATWVQRNVPQYSEMTFHPKMCAMNISWHQQPKKRIHSYIRRNIKEQ